MAPSNADTGASVRGALNTLRILEEVAARQPVGVSELAKATGIPKSSAQRFLLTLQQAGWLHQVGQETTRWALTAKALSVGLTASTELGLREAALPVMGRVRDETDETVHLAVRDGNALVVIDRLDSTQPVRTFVRLGTRVPMHATASGRAVLAHLPNAQVQQIIDLGLPRYTEHTIVDPAALYREIEATRERGYAINVCEWRPHVGAVGAAILSPTGQPVGALAISIPVVRYREDQVPRYGALGLEAGKEIGRLLRSE
ncbi:MAG: helix-turn-helix domain-containing protein [Streptosporangiales bacterium]|nr:helix-turn-helix domain-containing protein [Streptosporangiales bacterium]